ncbi:SanA/YdcF family protein [Reichenbachiella versicolor]|uniref:SanA/YdcF family protein n=1 Tax=Reichenbachiella versicolor TaxID=1821036 RepID=UPI000D6E460A|nr:ElyC/SanA/YdcF family protein [Reichenbachiella versicolor]
MKRLFYLAFFSLLAILLASNYWIISSTSDHIVEDTRELLGAEAGLVFGTSQYLKEGGGNPFFEKRIDAAYQLLASGKVEKLIVSGSKDSIYYNEAKAMKQALLQKGVSEEKIILDDFGNRTIHSISRLKNVYKIDQCVLVTQKYHAYRALFIAEKLGVDAVCFVADSPSWIEHSPAILREVVARPKAIIDLYITL